MAGLQRAEFVPSQKGAPQLLLDGHLYVKNKVKEDTIYWRCVDKSCRGKCTTVRDYIRNTTEHNHTPKDEREIKFIGTLRKRAREETTPMQQLYNNVIYDEDDDVTPHLPSFSSMRSAMYRHRRQKLTYQSSGPRLKMGEDFYYSKTEKKTRSLFSVQTRLWKHFSRRKRSSWMEHFHHVLLCGTKCTLFTVCLVPRCTLLCMLFSRTVRFSTYVRLINLLKIHVQQVLNRPLGPTVIQTDFEMAAIQAAEAEFPQAEVKGCLFHFCQGLWRKKGVRSCCGLQRRLRCEEVDPPCCRPPLLPLAQVQDAWMEAMDQCPDIHHALEMNDYIVATWVDDDARFPPRLWNHHATEGPRTNNNLEGFHSRIIKTIQHSHPNIFRFIELVQKVEKAERAKLAQINFGAAPPPRKAVYREKERRLMRLKDQLSRSSLMLLDH